nr:MAG TPA: hypothetical protein [Bacteriophage sp.]
MKTRFVILTVYINIHINSLIEFNMIIAYKILKYA